MRGLRRLVTVLLVSIGLVAVAVAQMSWWVEQTFIDEAGFSDVARTVLENKSVQSALADGITNRVDTGQVPPHLRPRIESAAKTVVASPAFVDAATAALVAAHRELLDGDNVVSASVALAPFRDQLQAAASSTDPALGGVIPPPGRLGDLAIALPPEFPDLARQASLIRSVAVWSLVVAIVGLAGAVAVSTRRPRTLVRIGIGLIAAVIIPIVLRFVVPSFAVNAAPDAEVQELAKALVGALFATYIRNAVIVAVIGAIAIVVGILWSRSVSRRFRHGRQVGSIGAPPSTIGVAPAPSANSRPGIRVFPSEAPVHPDRAVGVASAASPATVVAPRATAAERAASTVRIRPPSPAVAPTRPQPAVVRPSCEPRTGDHATPGPSDPAGPSDPDEIGWSGQRDDT